MADPKGYRGRERPYDERGRGGDRGSDGGYIARRGFGNRRSGYGPDEDEGGAWGSRRDQSRGSERDGDWGYPREDRRAYGGRERDYGDAAGYGGGGSWRDFRDVTGRDWDDDRFRHPDEVLRGRGTREAGSHGGGEYRGGYGADPHRDERGFFERAGDEIASWFGDDEAARRREHDTTGGGWSEGASSHRGRGPRNYRRSDERIREDVNDRLMDDPHVDASDVEVGVANGEVTLTGMVESRFAKRHAEDLAESVSGVSHVQNNLRVRRDTSREGATGAVTSMVEETDGGRLGRGTAGALTGRVGPTSAPRRRRGPVLE